MFGPGVTVAGRGAEIRAFCHIEGATIGPGAIVGPFARLRPGAELGEGAHVGNFVEIKNAELGAGAKANHLTYLGDADVGARANIGAGTITCNYDGFDKHRTEIGAGAFIGSNTALVAPVKVGDGRHRRRRVSVITARRAAGRAGHGARPAGGASRAGPGSFRAASAGARQQRKDYGNVRHRRHSRQDARSAPLLLEALRRLEYRGYDSAPASPRWSTAASSAAAPRASSRNLDARAGARAAARHDRHRPHALGDAWRADRAQRPSARHRPGRASCTTASSRISSELRAELSARASASRPRPTPRSWRTC